MSRKRSAPVATVCTWRTARVRAVRRDGGTSAAESPPKRQPAEQLRVIFLKALADPAVTKRLDVFEDLRRIAPTIAAASGTKSYHYAKGWARRAHLACKRRSLQVGGASHRSLVAVGPGSSKSDRACHMDTHASARRSMASACSGVSPVPVSTLRRHDPRQEPDAVVPPVRICGGGEGRPLSLLRLSSEVKSAVHELRDLKWRMLL
jgi:hypothetical protein